MKEKKEQFDIFKKGFVGGVGWALGVTVGLVLISSLLVVTLNYLGGLPIIGKWIAAIVEATQAAMGKRF